MSNEQAAIATTYAAIIQSVASIAQILIALVAIVLARKEFRKWRQELLGTKQFELGIQLGKAAYAVESAFDDARSTYSCVTYDAYHPYIDDIGTKINLLQEIQLDASLLFRKDQVKAISKQISEYNMLHMKLRMASWLKYHPDDMEKYEATPDGGLILDEGVTLNIKNILNSIDDLISGRKFGKEINSITKNIVEIASQFTK